MHRFKAIELMMLMMMTTGSPPVTSPPLYILLVLHQKNFDPQPLVTDFNVPVPAFANIENKAIAFFTGDCYSWNRTLKILVYVPKYATLVETGVVNSFLLIILEYHLNGRIKAEQDFERYSNCKFQMFHKHTPKVFSFNCFSYALQLLIYIKILFIFYSFQKHIQGKDNRDKSLAL